MESKVSLTGSVSGVPFFYKFRFTKSVAVNQLTTDCYLSVALALGLPSDTRRGKHFQNTGLLEIAVYVYRRPSRVALLLEYNAPISRYALQNAILFDLAEVVDFFVRSGVCVNETSNDVCRPVAFAIQMASLQVVKSLVTAGAVLYKKSDLLLAKKSKKDAHSKIAFIEETFAEKLRLLQEFLN